MGASYYWYKDNGICVRCGQRRAIEGKTMCSVCQEKIRKWYKDNRSKRCAKGRQHYKERKAQGVCVSCGISRPVEGRVRCATCMKYQRAAGRESYLKKLEERSKKA